jgi:hypothetical protein
MRLTEERYYRDCARLQIAVQFLKHKARTYTICLWTGLTEDRVRKLYRCYVSADSTCMSRSRGKSPRRIELFGQSERYHREAACLASLLTLLKVVPTANEPLGAEGPYTLVRAMHLCQAFEMYRAIVESPKIDFEHAVLLATTLTRGKEMRLDVCRNCDGLVLAGARVERVDCCYHCAGRLPGRIGAHDSMMMQATRSVELSRWQRVPSHE